jgi:L,D-transpeptidase catalytic domain
LAGAALPDAGARSAEASLASATEIRAVSADPAVTMTNARIAHWAPVVSDVSARRLPTERSSVVTRIGTVTGDGTQNILLILARRTVSPTQTWCEVRLAMLPNDSTGWVPRSALGTIYAVATHLYVDRETFTATLDRGGVPIFRTRIGVGEPYWPTPAGQFYIRDELTDFHNPFYGPLAFGTSARSAVLTEWPGGGFIGVHGTNEPEILPGAVSHGCVRMTNSAILRLARLMPIGTPVTIS